MDERHELEDINREAQDIEQTMRWEAFKPDAVAQVVDCLKEDGDLVDLINDLDLNYDDIDSLSNSDINEIIMLAVAEVSSTEKRRK